MSRRRGTSIGINLFPVKSVCSFNCIYCFRGGAQIRSCTPTSGPYNIGPDEVKKALEEALENVNNVKSIDFSGNGEPTLHTRFKDIVKEVRALIEKEGLDVSLGLFTNSSMLRRAEVLEAINMLDHVEAKLDSVVEWKFRIINRPCKGLRVKDIVENLVNLRKRFKGELAIQVMVLRYLKLKNYTERDARLLAQELHKVDPDVVNVYTVYRKPRLSNVLPAPKEDMDLFSKVLREEGFRVNVYYE
jgi:wyosine [tRNA(Phe)-imidazoG37] synthetase (radical SAM superfamily)